VTGFGVTLIRMAMPPQFSRLAADPRRWLAR